MKRLLPPLLAAIALIACQWDKNPSEIITKNPGNYEAFKTSVITDKATFSRKPHTEVSNYLFHLINDSIPAYWNGTRWDF